MCDGATCNKMHSKGPGRLTDGYIHVAGNEQILPNQWRQLGMCKTEVATCTCMQLEKRHVVNNTSMVCTYVRTCEIGARVSGRKCVL